MSGPPVSIDRLGAGDLPELTSLFGALGLYMPQENVEQFARPRQEAPGIEVVTLGMRESGRLVGTMGWLELPFQLPGGARTSARWMVNYYVLPELRGRGLGRRLEEATRHAAGYHLITGGTPHSIPIFEKAGWRLLGQVESWRWIAPCLSLSRMAERRAGAGRIAPPSPMEFRIGSGTGSRVSCAQDSIRECPWAADPLAGGPDEGGVPRTAAYLAYAFEGPLARQFRLHEVRVDGAPAGFFALAVRPLRWPLLGADIIDLDALPGREGQVVEAARRMALACADVARLRITPVPRFVRALEKAKGRRVPGSTIPLRMHHGPGIPGDWFDPERWRVTPGDHDQYRIRKGSQAWDLVPRSSAPQRR